MFYLPLAGPIPTELGRLAELREVFFSNNQLSGESPCVNMLTTSPMKSLEWVGHRLQSRGERSQLLPAALMLAPPLAGPIPPELGNLPALQDLFLAGNQLSGKSLGIAIIECIRIDESGSAGVGSTQVAELREAFLPTPGKTGVYRNKIFVKILKV